jgi:hypothetical protein
MKKSTKMKKNGPKLGEDAVKTINEPNKIKERIKDTRPKILFDWSEYHKEFRDI